MKKSKVNDVEHPEIIIPHTELIAIHDDLNCPKINIGKQDRDYVARTTTENKGGGSIGAHKRYQDIMDALLMPVSSYNLLYGPHNASTSKIVPKSKSPYKKIVVIPSRKEAEYESFPKNVRALTATGMLDGATVQYVSASSGIELSGIIKGTYYVCGCKSCNYTKALCADDFECHAGRKTSHSNNHICLENGKSLHYVVQELKHTSRINLCDTIETVIGRYLNREAFNSWKESFERYVQTGSEFGPGNVAD